MMKYIWLNDKSSILNQVSKYFNSAAIIFNPFIKMPEGWDSENIGEDGHYRYPEIEEISEYGKAVPWSELREIYGFKDNKELLIGLKSSILALNKEYNRDDLRDKILYIEDMFQIGEDDISELYMEEFLKILVSKGAEYLYYSAPIKMEDGRICTKNIKAEDIFNITYGEIIIVDENMEFGFMSLFDSFITLFFTNTNDIEKIMNENNWEGIICDDNTNILWYLD